jgi:nitrite reductase (NADH) large subunit
MGMPTVWKCDVCGYVHNGPRPPDNCPICGVDRSNFSPFDVSQPRPPSEPSASVWECSICGYRHQGSAPPSSCPICDAQANFFEPIKDSDGEATSSDIARVVIIGGGIAGLTTAEHARNTNSKVTITLLLKESDLPYYRLNLTRLLAGEINEDSLPIHDDPWYTENRIDIVRDEVVAIEREEKRVRLMNKGVLNYDRLVLANGAHPFVPPISGATRAGVYLLRTIDDARRITERSTKGLRCVCIGGGLLGLEIAGALRKRGVAVTVLEGFPWLLPRQLPPPAGELLIRYITNQGIGVRCGVKVSEIVGDEEARGVKLESGEVIDADFVILSAGVRPNSYLARRCGLKVAAGIIVDDRLATSDEAIFAAGDVAEHRGVLYGIWPASYSQGAVAGINAAGGQAEFTGLAPSSRLKVLDIDLFSIGDVHASDGSFLVFEKSHNENYVRIVCRDGVIAGAALFGKTELAALLKDAVEKSIQISELTQLKEQLPGWSDFLK